MVSVKMKRIFLLVTIITLVVGLTACSGTTQKGLLQGKVNIGPISPVDQPGIATPIPCDVYNARKIMIYDKTGSNLIQQVDIECNAEENYARYRIELKPGTYTVDINHLGIDSSKDVPKQVEIKAGITTRLDIDIDTGIR